MEALRHILRRNTVAAWTVIALALLLKLLVPAGFMPTMTAHGLEMTFCPGMVEIPTAATKPMAGMAHAMPGHQQGKEAPAKPDSPCAFAGLTAPSLGGTDIVLLAMAFAAIVAASLFFQPIAPITRRAFLRPPLRGPPAHI